MQCVPIRVHLFKSTRNQENLSGPARGRVGLTTTKIKNKTRDQTKQIMKKLLTLTSILCAVATLTFVTGCSSTSTTTTASPQKESLLQQAGFHTMTVTTPTQKQRVEALPVGKVSAVKYKGKLYYVYPTAQKDRIYYGKQAQFNAYKQSLRNQQGATTDGGISHAHGRGRRPLQHPGPTV